MYVNLGKYVNFNTLLPNTENTVPVQVAQPAPQSRRRQHRTPGRKVIDFHTWMEAWNTFLLITSHTSPSRCLELIKYQALISHLFQAYPVQVCLRYDQLFRRAAARDPQLQWDSFKEDLFVWCSTRRPFRQSISACLRPPVNQGLPSASTPGGPLQCGTHTPSGAEICKRYNAGNCTRGEKCKFAHSCWHVSCRGAHPAKTCPLHSSG